MTSCGPRTSSLVVDEALNALNLGKPTLLVDDSSVNGRGYVFLAAELAEPRWTSWMVRHASGWLCLPMPESRADELQLPLMASATATGGPRYCVAIDAATGIGTGISANDRTRTARVAASRDSVPSDLCRPGHVLPIRTDPGGVRIRCRPAEAAVEMLGLAGLRPVAMAAELMRDDGEVLSGNDIFGLAQSEGLAVVGLTDVAQAVLADTSNRLSRVDRSNTATLAIRDELIDVITYRDLTTGAEHMVLGAARAQTHQPLIVILEECAAGHVFGTTECECRHELSEALDALIFEHAIVVYLRTRLQSHVSISHPARESLDAGVIAGIIVDLDLDLTRVALRSRVFSTAKLSNSGLSAQAADPAPGSRIA